jgi:hypothetical protein
MIRIVFLMLIFLNLKRLLSNLFFLITSSLSTLNKGPFSYYVRVKGWVGGIAKYLLFLTGVGGWFWITLT